MWHRHTNFDHLKFQSPVCQLSRRCSVIYYNKEITVPVTEQAGRQASVTNEWSVASDRSRAVESCDPGPATRINAPRQRRARRTVGRQAALTAHTDHRPQDTSMRAAACTPLCRPLALLLPLLLATATWARVVPNNVPICKRSDPQYDACVVKSVETIRPHLVKGIPKMRVPPCEPLVIPALAIDRNLEALKVTADLKNIRVFGGTNFVINKLKTDLPGLSVELSVSFPHIYLISDYDIDGRILVVPLKGRGEFRGNFTDVKGDIRGKGMLVNISGKQYLQVQKLTASADVKDAVPQIINKDKSTEAITSTASIFINENKRQVFQIIKPLVDDTLGAVLTEFTNSILRTVTIDEILPE